MNVRQQPLCKRRTAARALTLVEMLIATGVGAIMVTIILALAVYGERSFAVTSSHVDLEGKSRHALDVLSRELRQATSVTVCNTTPPFKSLTLTNAIEGSTLTVSWDGEAQTLTLPRRGPTPADDRNEKLLTDCTHWDFALCDRIPTISPTAVTFNRVSKIANCKLILMSWSCRHEVIGKLETENVQELQIALRNKLN